MLTMNARIYHNPACGTSRKTLDILKARPGLEVEVIEYLKSPPDRGTLAALYSRAGIAPRQGLRTRNTDAVARGLTEADDATVLAAMIADPVLIERPLVETEKGVRLCRPPERVHEIL
jgi:arsenate reductase (glutaredoxin)